MVRTVGIVCTSLPAPGSRHCTPWTPPLGVCGSYTEKDDYQRIQGKKPVVGRQESPQGWTTVVRHENTGIWLHLFKDDTFPSPGWSSTYFCSPCKQTLVSPPSTPPHLLPLPVLNISQYSLHLTNIRNVPFIRPRKYTFGWYNLFCMYCTVDIGV
jgi:hypothetical protein